MALSCLTVNNRLRLSQSALLGSAIIFFLLLAGVLQPALAASPITGVTVAPAAASVSSGGAVYLRAAVQGTGDFDHRVNWSLSTGNAGSVSPTGLFISHPAFTGTATVTATSVESSTFNGAATITVGAGGGVAHVDLNNGGIEDGTALHPYRTIQGAIDHAADGGTIKVAQGGYAENVVLPGNLAFLLLGGFEGGSAADYAGGPGGDFVTRSTDHVLRRTTIQSHSGLTTPVVFMDALGATDALTYAVDGFILTYGSHGLQVNGSGPVTFFISQNLITHNGNMVAGPDQIGGGIKADGVNTLVLNNRIAENISGFAGGISVNASANSFLIQGNLIEDNICGGVLGGGAAVGQLNAGQGPGLFTWNIVRGNIANLFQDYGGGGGIWAGGGQIELSHNSYSDNESKSQGAGVFIDSGTVVLRHELVYKNRTPSSYGGAGIMVAPGAQVTLEHCTITGNTAPGLAGNGLQVRETATVQVSNSIIWGNSGDQLYLYGGAIFSMTYSDSQPYAGTGNISVDPLFAAPITDDYHLKSKRGRWDPALAQWVTDSVHSPCIDKGDPAAAFDQEPIPNRSRTNMGVYGNTPEASKSQAALEGMFQLLLLVD